MVLELSIVLVLLVANGVFSMTEIAVVSARKGRLRHLAEGGDDVHFFHRSKQVRKIDGEFGGSCGGHQQFRRGEPLEVGPLAGQVLKTCRQRGRAV